MYWQLVEGLRLTASEESEGEAHDEKVQPESPSVTPPPRRRQYHTSPESPDSKRKPPEDEG